MTQQASSYTINNPILTGFNPDPSICRVGEDYYIAVSTFEWFPGVQIYHSKDLKNWQLVAQPLNTVKHLDMKGNPDSGGVWAPCLSYEDGMFYMIYSDVKVVAGAWKDTYNYLTTCKTIDGEWSEPIYLNTSGFDPSLFHHPNGKKYLVNMLWDHRSHKHSFGGIVLQEYCHNEKKLIGERKLIYKGSDWGLTEAPHLYFINDYYYLLVAEGGTVYEHAARIVRSKNIDGPYEECPDAPLISAWHDINNPLQKAGHASIVQTHTNEWYLVHLTGRPYRLSSDSLAQDRGYCALGRESAIQKVEWRDNWPYVVGGNSPSSVIEGMKGVKEGEPVKIESLTTFDRTSLPMEFQTVRIPFNEEIGSLTDKPGVLRLYGRESLSSMFTLSLVARRWKDFSFVAETELSFEPDTFQQQAGLICYYNTKNWVSVHITCDEEYGRVIDIMSSDRAKMVNVLNPKDYVIPAGVKQVKFKVAVERDKYCFYYAFDGGEFKHIPHYFDSYKLSDDYIQEGGFFTGAFVGMHCNDTSGQRRAADFSYFKYEAN